MKPSWSLIPLVIVIAFMSCGRPNTYFQSPLHTNTASYKAIPLHIENVRAATYANLTFSTGGANENQRDGFNIFLGSIHRAHNFGNFQAFYGLTGSLGNYHVSKSGLYSRTPPPDAFNQAAVDSFNAVVKNLAGGKFLGSWGVTGGINLVIPFSDGAEWRIIGTEFSWNQEFGSYQKFRKNLDDSAANLVDRHNNYLTIAITTDMMGKTRKGSIGYKFAYVLPTRSLTVYYKDGHTSILHPGYLSNTVHLTVNRVTGFTQFNLGSYAVNWQLGLNFQIGY